MSILKTEDCPICDNPTNAFQKTLVRYNGKWVCRNCYAKIIKCGINAQDIKRKSLLDLQQIVGNIEGAMKQSQGVILEKGVFVEAKKGVTHHKNGVIEKIRSGEGYHIEDTNTAIAFYENHFEFVEKRYSIHRSTIEYDIEKLFLFKLDKVNYQSSSHYNALHVHYFPYSGALVSKMLIVHFDQKELKHIEQLVEYLNEKIIIKQQYDKEQKEKKEKEEYERVHGKHRYSTSKFAFLDGDYYLKYGYYDVLVKGSDYCEFDISTIQIEQALYFEFEPDNMYDSNAIKILYNNVCIGYIPKNNLQKMMRDFYEDHHGQVRGFISRVDEDTRRIEIGLGFYKEQTAEELKKIPHIDAKLTKTSKKDYADISRQEHLEGVFEGDEVELEYQYDTETYLVSDSCYNELGEINVSQSRKLQEYEDEGAEFYAAVLETDYTDAGKKTCTIRIFIRQ